MPVPGRDYLRSSLATAEAPWVSIYLPTHRSHPDNVKDPIRFKNLVTEVENSLNRRHPVREVRALVEPLNRLQANATFWNHTLDGLAVLASAARFDVFKLPRAVPEL